MMAWGGSDAGLQAVYHTGRVTAETAPSSDDTAHTKKNVAVIATTATLRR